MKTTRRRGAALVGSMTLVLVASLLIGGVVTVTVNQRNLATTRTNSEAALLLAEAGINDELNRITRRIALQLPENWGTAMSPTPGEPFPGRKGSVTGVNGNYWVYSAANPEGTQPWNGLTPLYVVCHARVNGATRRVVVGGEGMKQGLFGEFAVFGNDASAGDNSLAIGLTGNNNVIHISGIAGTNGRVQKGNYTLTYDAAYNCNTQRYYGTSFTQFQGGSIFNKVDPWYWPTVNQVVKQIWPSADTSNLATTAAFLKGIRENSSKIRTWKPNLTAGTALSSTSTQLAGFPSSGDDSVELINKKGNSLARWEVANLKPGSTSTRTLILPPGDYFFEDINLIWDSRTELIVDNAGLSVGGNPNNKQVRIWVFGSRKYDIVSLPIQMTAPNDPSTFRIYYGKDDGEFEFRRDSNYTGEFRVAGCVYAITGLYGNESMRGTKVDFIGGTDSSKTIQLVGSLIGDRVEFNGYGLITHPGQAIQHPEDPAGGFGFNGTYIDSPY